MLLRRLWRLVFYFIGVIDLSSLEIGNKVACLRGGRPIVSVLFSSESRG